MGLVRVQWGIKDKDRKIINIRREKESWSKGIGNIGKHWLIDWQAWTINRFYSLRDKIR